MEFELDGSESDVCKQEVGSLKNIFEKVEILVCEIN
jgi:hypothetical protein